MRLWDRSPDDPVPVVWYRIANPKPHVYTKPCVFRSRNYEDQCWHEGIGEQRPPEWLKDCPALEWYRGNDPCYAKGVKPCGSDDVAARGGIWGQDPFFITALGGCSPCCETHDIGPGTGGGEGEGVQGHLWSQRQVLQVGEGEASRYKPADILSVHLGEGEATASHVWSNHLRGLVGEGEATASHLYSRWLYSTVGEGEATLSLWLQQTIYGSVGEGEACKSVACPDVLIDTYLPYCDSGYGYVVIQYTPLNIVNGCLTKGAPFQVYGWSTGCCFCPWNPPPGSFPGSVFELSTPTSGSGAGSSGGGNVCTVTPTSLTILLSGGTGVTAVLNGTYTLAQSGPCEWQDYGLVNGVPYLITASVGPGGWDVIVTYGPGSQPIAQMVYHVDGSAFLPDCCKPVTASLEDCKIYLTDSQQACNACANGAQTPSWSVGPVQFNDQIGVGQFSTFNGMWSVYNSTGGCSWTATRPSNLGPQNQTCGLSVELPGTISVKFSDPNVTPALQAAFQYVDVGVTDLDCCTGWALRQTYPTADLGQGNLVATPTGPCNPPSGSGPAPSTGCPTTCAITPDCGAPPPVITTCCDRQPGSNWTAEISGSGNCDGSYALTYDPVSLGWSYKGPIGNCTSGPDMAMLTVLCNGDNAYGFQLSGAALGPDILSPTSATCDPKVVLTYYAPLLTGCCTGGPVTVTVREL